MSTSASARSYLTAGIAAVGASAIALTPVAAVGPDPALLPHRVGEMAVGLASTIDPFTPWVTTFETALENITRIVSAVAANPLPILQQVVNNQLIYLSELPDIGTILGQVADNVGNALGAPFAADPTNISSAPVASISLGPGFEIQVSQQLVFGLLPDVLGDLYPTLEPFLNFTTSPASGVLLSAIGPIISPVLAVVNSAGAIIDALGSGDFVGAINELINIPANAVNAFLNGGQFLDLGPVLSLVGVTLPDSIQSLGFNMGGLLSTGINPVPTEDPVPVAGVMFDGLAFTADLGLGAPVVDPGLSVGPIGALLGLNAGIAEAIKVTPPSEAPTDGAAPPAQATVAEAPEAAAALEVEANLAASPAESAPQAAEAEAAVTVSAPREPAEAATAEPAENTGATTVRRAPRAERSADSGAATSTPKRAARGAVSRAG